MAAMLTRFQQDIENKAVAARQKMAELMIQVSACADQLAEMYAACPWLDPTKVDERAEKRVKEDEDARGKIRGGVMI